VVTCAAAQKAVINIKSRDVIFFIEGAFILKNEFYKNSKTKRCALDLVRITKNDLIRSFVSKG
jgi:hypothetical protein